MVCGFCEGIVNGEEVEAGWETEPVDVEGADVRCEDGTREEGVHEAMEFV